MGTHPVDALVTHRYVDGWRNQIPALVAAGYRVVAPAMRGYNLSDKPPLVADYQAHRLAEDLQ